MGLYLHIPFCRSKCLYCDFCSFPRPTGEWMEAYAAALCRELGARAGDCRGYTVDTVYFGGGTPTCLPAATLCRILDAVRTCYRVAEDAEITAECNPGTVTAAELSALRRGGFNRLSIGLQSAQPGELRALGRLHDFPTFAETFAAARAAGFDNLSADVMFGIPHQTPESFADTLEKLCALRPDHVSAYALTVEDGTPFGRRGAAALVAVTGQDEANLIACQLAKKQFEVPRAAARVNNPKNTESLKKLGVDITMCSTEILTRLLEREVETSALRHVMSLSGGQADLTEVLLPTDFALAGQTLTQAPIPPEVVLVSITRNGRLLIPRGGTVLLPGDRVLCLARDEGLRQLMRDWKL